MGDRPDSNRLPPRSYTSRAGPRRSTSCAVVHAEAGSRDRRRMTVRTVIKGGTVVDGTGAPRYRADVAVENSTIVEIGAALEGTNVLDAGGCVVAPGFIDVH